MKKYLPMLCKSGKKELLKNKKYFWEPKIDGTRAVFYVKGNSFKTINRRGNRIDPRYPDFKDLPKFVEAKSCVLDAEIVCYNKKGNPDFNLLQQREQLSRKLLIELRAREIPATIIFFDIMEKNGKSLIKKPLTERKEILDETVKENKFIQKIIFTDDGQKLWREIKKRKLEGVVAKAKDSLYYPGKRIEEWLKIKFLKTVDCIIVGFTKGKGGRQGLFGSFALAVYRKNKLYYVGRCGTGLTEKDLKNIYPQLKKRKVKKIPVINPPEDWQKHEITWMKPELICEVEFLELTRYNELRAPVFKRMRFDKPLKDCTWEEQLMDLEKS